MEKLLNLLRPHGEMSSPLLHPLQKNVEPFEYKKGKTILEIGEIADLILFIEEGLVLSYYKVGNKEVSNWFMGKGEIFISVLSFHRRTPSLDSHIALTDCKCLGFRHDALEETYDRFPEFNRHGRMIEAEYYCLSEERHIMLKRQPSEIKFKALMEQYPDLHKYATHEQLASFLNMGLRTYDSLWKKYCEGGMLGL